MPAEDYEILDPRFARLINSNAHVERLFTGCIWAEGPAWFAAGRYLITQRRKGSHLAGRWEFPGGKVEPGESPAACLRRELTEELSATFTLITSLQR